MRTSPRTAPRTAPRTLLVVTLLALCPTTLGLASATRSPQGATADEPLAAESIAAQSTIAEVTLYQGRAMVSRAARSPAREGLFELRFEGLPPALDSSTLQATVRSERGGARLLDVRYEETVTQSDVTNNPELRDAIARLETARRGSEALAMRMAAINDRYTLLNSIRQKIATENAKDFGSQALDPDALARQVAFLGSAQEQLIQDRIALDAETRANADEINALAAKVNALGGQTKIDRTAIVSIGQAAAEAADVTLRYLVGNAGWQPRYSVRADADAETLVVEYDAEIRQGTGEDWSDVMLTLSTAQPTRRAAPGEVPLAFVDIVLPPPPGAPAVASNEVMYDAAPARKARAKGGFTGGGSEGGEVMTLGLEMADAPMNAALAYRFEDAAAVRSGTVVAYPIPRALSIPSDAQKTRKHRIATVETKPAFIHVARPIVESAVYLKATAANGSSYQFLAGPATVFLGGDSVGLASLPDLAPGAEMTFWLGTDPRIEAKRVLVKKSTSESGVFTKSDDTRWDFRVDLASTADKPVTVELADRIPVSRNEQIRIELKDLSQPLVTDAKFVADERPQGVLKWLVQLPAQSKAGTPAAKSVSWSVVASKPKDVMSTPIPD